MIRSCVIIVMLVGAAAALAGEPVQWLDSAEASATKAKENGLPILFLLVPKAGDAEAAATEPPSLTDPPVARFLNSHWIPVRLRASTTTEILLEQLEVPESPPWSAVATSPEGRRIGTISAAKVAAPDQFIERLQAIYVKYCANILETRIQPILQKEDASPADVLTALRQVRTLGIAGADKPVIALLDRKDLNENQKDQVYKTLARLSTPRSVTALLAAAQTSESARQSLNECTPAGAEALLADVQPADGDRLVIACTAACAICQIPDCKAADFWTTGDTKAHQAELDRLRREVKQAADKWRETAPLTTRSRPENK